MVLLCSLADGAGVGANQPSAEPVPTHAGADHRDSGSKKRKTLEAEFAAMLTGAVLKGSWRISPEVQSGKTSPLSEPHNDHYVIRKTTKLTGDRWLITARIQHGNNDVTVPVPVRVLWAGDTPVITVDTVPIPMLGEYSARVMVYKGFYCGTWLGDGYGGVMSGQILRHEPSCERRHDEPVGGETTLHPDDKENNSER
jgi:hypothetical protein